MATTSKSEAFYEIGAVKSTLDVQLSYRIIQLFSEGLYASPSKAVEELVANSFDAGAEKVFVAVDWNLSSADSAIAVIDDGAGMTIAGLKQHWVIGASSKRATGYRAAKGRQPIGKFGIGKLASYVLANRLTHITKVNDRYFSTSMDYRSIPDEPLGVTVDADEYEDADELSVATVEAEPAAEEVRPKQQEPVTLAIRELSEEDATHAVSRWTRPSETKQVPVLFGEGAPAAWTVAVMSDLKPMARDLTPGRLQYVLSSAMPLRDDFQLALDGKPIKPSKTKQKHVGTWALGKEIRSVPRPASDDFEISLDPDLPTEERHGLISPKLGRVWGYVEVFADPIDTGKSQNVGRSNGFFVYSRGRLLNVDDSGFGIDRNLLRHGTFSRTRIVIHVDILDEELRSSRETLREGPVVESARDLLQGLFNFARSRLKDNEETNDPTARLTKRLADAPDSIAKRPLMKAVSQALEDDRPLVTIDLPRGLNDEQRMSFAMALEARADNGQLVASTTHADLSGNDPIARFNAESGELVINTLHPFVATFFDDYADSRSNLPLELFAAAEVFLEADLLSTGMDPSQARSVLEERDLLLRSLARSSGHSNAITVANRLRDAVNNEKELESAVVAAFDSLGYIAVPKGGKDNPDGIADAPLPPIERVQQGYRVSLEAKSKQKSGAAVTKDGVKVSTVARHRDDNKCDHSIVVGQDFATKTGDKAAVLREIKKDKELNDGKRTITLIRVDDLATLVRLAPKRRLGLNDIRPLFQCESPEESHAWVEAISKRSVPELHHKEILEVVWEEQLDDPLSAVEYPALRTALKLKKKLRYSDDELRDECMALSRMAPGHVFATHERVEINIRPDAVLRAIGAISDYEKDSAE